MNGFALTLENGFRRFAFFVDTGLPSTLGPRFEAAFKWLLRPFDITVNEDGLLPPCSGPFGTGHCVDAFGEAACDGRHCGGELDPDCSNAYGWCDPEQHLQNCWSAPGGTCCDCWCSPSEGYPNYCYCYGPAN
jgi:hypothetical protein